MHQEIIDSTRLWLEKSVIGLGLCPFAQPAYENRRVRFYVSESKSAEELLRELESELNYLVTHESKICETTLLIHPWVMGDFADYNDFISICDAALVELELEGELQIASFHPQYQFADTDPDDIENYTNRSPYPTLHLLREHSIDLAIAGSVNTDEIYLRNIRTLRGLGHAGWFNLWRTS